MIEISVLYATSIDVSVAAPPLIHVQSAELGGAAAARVAADVARGYRYDAEAAATAAEASANETAFDRAATEAAWDAFDDRYLGSKASAPIVDNDGAPLLIGAMYWDTTASRMHVWDGSAWHVGYTYVTTALDGGGAASAYLAAQIHDGGSANG